MGESLESHFSHIPPSIIDGEMDAVMVCPRCSSVVSYYDFLFNTCPKCGKHVFRPPIVKLIAKWVWDDKPWWKIFKAKTGQWVFSNKQSGEHNVRIPK